MAGFLFCDGAPVWYNVKYHTRKEAPTDGERSPS